MKIRILSRKSDLAVVQAHEFANLFYDKYPEIKIQFITKSTSGDKDLTTALSEMPTEGVFTDDLRKDLINKNCDLIIHSWKDLPLDIGEETEIAITLNRADERDLLFIKKKNINKIKEIGKIIILSSSPRRKYNLENFIKEYLPLNINEVIYKNIRGNIITRFKKFMESDNDGFVVAKAAIDRLLQANQQLFPNIKESLNSKIKKCLWNIVPISINPASPGQGALAVEVRSEDKKIKQLLIDLNNKTDYENVKLERDGLKKFGGGCHQKIGITFQSTNFGKIKSSKGQKDDGESFRERVIIQDNNEIIKKINSENEIFPQKIDDYVFFTRNTIEESRAKILQLREKCIWISRKSALPENQEIHESNVIWVSGLATWRSLAKRGIWVNGTADNLGEWSEPNIKSLFSEKWVKLTHADAPLSKIKEVIKTYKLEKVNISYNFKDVKHFYWMSSSAFKYAIEKYPFIKSKFHYCGPGNTFNEIKKILGNNSENLSVELSYKIWKNKMVLKIFK